jgi:UDP-N-acetylglucosamine diphosphorylase/glucosamine-1-phosphate N-acetyltransferase
MTITFDDNNLHENFAPLTLTRPVSELRFGIDTISDSWISSLGYINEEVSIFYNTEAYLSSKFKATNSPELIIAGNIKPSADLAILVNALKEGEFLTVNGEWIATHTSKNTEISKQIEDNLLIKVENLWDLFELNGKAIELDFQYKISGKTTQHLSSTNRTIGNHEIFIEEGAKIECAILNSENGPIYIGKNTEIMEGSVIRGPFALGEGAVVKMGAKIYGPTTIGKYCKVGGEITNSIFLAYSNKGHDGFVGNSLIGEWCNFGADTNTSNLKNNYSNVRLHSYKTGNMEDTDVLFCGVIMGDHSKTGINTMLNTATSVGVCSNIFGGGFPPKHVPSFSWGGFKDSDTFKLEKAIEVAERMMKRRGIDLSKEEISIFSHLFNQLA